MIMTEYMIRERAKMIVSEYIEKIINKGQYPKGINYSLSVVWQCWILRNMKFLITADFPDGRYFEVTYNSVTREFYLDVYVRVHNEAIPF